MSGNDNAGQTRQRAAQGAPVTILAGAFFNGRSPTYQRGGPLQWTVAGTVDGLSPCGKLLGAP